MKIMLFAVLVSAVLAEVAGAALPFRLGRILAAEATRRAVPLTGMEEHAFEFDFENRAYAVVVARLQPGRTLSIYDFSLEIGGKAYPCVALRSGTGNFDAKDWVLKKTSPDETYSMLFIIDPARIGSGAEFGAALVYNLSQKGLRRTPVPFKNLGSGALTPVSDIPAAGVFPDKPAQP